MEKNNTLTMRFLAEPADINFGGKVHGGAVMKWIDQCGYACASDWSNQYCVTIYVGGIRFIRPIQIGSLVEAHAQLIYTGRTSMHIAVNVFARNPRKGKKMQTTHCIIVFVAVDADGKPNKVPSYIPKTEKDKQLETYAKSLMQKRREIEEEMAPFFVF